MSLAAFRSADIPMRILSVLSHRFRHNHMTVETAVAPRPARRLSDKIEQAFDQACGHGQLQVAACMLKGLDMALLGREQPWEERQTSLTLIRSLQERLQVLRDAEAACLGRSWDSSPRGRQHRAACQQVSVETR